MCFFLSFNFFFCSTFFSLMHAYTGSVADCKLSYATFSATIFPSRSDCFGTTNPPKSSQIEAWRLVELTSTKELERNPHGRNVAIWPSGEDFLLPPSATLFPIRLLYYFFRSTSRFTERSLFSAVATINAAHFVHFTFGWSGKSAFHTINLAVSNFQLRTRTSILRNERWLVF